MSLNGVKRALRDVEAVQKYDGLKRDYDTLNENLAESERVHSADREKFLTEIKELQGKLASFQALKIKYADESYSLEEFDKFSKLVVEKERDTVVKKRVAERWSRESPALIKEAVAKELEGYHTGKCSPATRTAVEACGMKRAEEILRTEAYWPSWFRTLVENRISNGIANGLDEEFQRRVNHQSSVKIQQLVSTSWPKFIAEQVTPRFQGNLADMLRKVSSPVTIFCTKCGTEQTLQIEPMHVAQLIRDGAFPVQCINSNCRDFIFPHNNPITLGALILALTGHNPVNPP